MLVPASIAIPMSGSACRSVCARVYIRGFAFLKKRATLSKGRRGSKSGEAESIKTGKYFPGGTERRWVLRLSRMMGDLNHAPSSTDKDDKHVTWWQQCPLESHWRIVVSCLAQMKGSASLVLTHGLMQWPWPYLITIRNWKLNSNHLIVAFIFSLVLFLFCHHFQKFYHY